jgi:hypothetical protein
MASIYDIAKIQSGDPMGRAREGGREASALLAQYEHQKEIIDEINKQIKAAEKKAGKNKQGWGLGGSILGGLLGAGLTAATGGAAAPWIAKLAPYMSTLGAGLGSGIMEKQRQDYVGATKGLKELEKKLKGRKQFEDVKSVREGMEGSLDEMLLSGAINAMTMDMIMPTLTKQGKVVTEELIGESVVPTEMLNKQVTDIIDGESVAGRLIQEGSSVPVSPEFNLAGEAFDPNLTSFGYGANVQLDPLGVSQEGITAVDSFGESLAIDPKDAAFYKDQGYELLGHETGNPGWYKPELNIERRVMTDPGGMTYVDTPDGAVKTMIGPTYDIQSEVAKEDFIPIKQGNVRSESFQADPFQTEAKLVVPEIEIGGYESAEILSDVGTSGYADSGPFVPEGMVRTTGGISYDTPSTVNIGGINIPVSESVMEGFKKRATEGQNILASTPFGKMLGDTNLSQMALFQNPYINNLMKILGPQFMAPSMPQQRRFTGPTFRNPYGGGGGY